MLIVVMPSVTYKPFMLSVVMLIVVMLSIVAPKFFSIQAPQPKAKHKKSNEEFDFV
jgi:hypothetical protein